MLRHRRRKRRHRHKRDIRNMHGDPAEARRETPRDPRSREAHQGDDLDVQARGQLHLRDRHRRLPRPQRAPGQELQAHPGRSQDLQLVQLPQGELRGGALVLGDPALGRKVLGAGLWCGFFRS